MTLCRTQEQDVDQRSIHSTPRVPSVSIGQLGAVTCVCRPVTKQGI